MTIYVKKVDIPDSGKQIGFVHRERGKTLLPQMPAPAFPEVDMPGVSPVGLADGTGKSFSTFRHGDNVDMFLHQTPCPDGHFAIAASLGNEAKIIILAEKCLVSAVSSLGNAPRALPVRQLVLF